MTFAPPVGVGITLSSELFVQSDRMAAVVITGGQRYLLFSLVGVTFPFLIVSTKKHHRSPAAVASAQMFEFQHAKLLLIHGSVSSVSQKALDSYCFLLFTGVCAVGCLYTFFILPETKGKTMVEISNEFKAITICGKSPEEAGAETKF